MKERKGKMIVWPEYIDSTRTRSQGRRIPSNLAAPEVTVKILKEAADTVGLEAEVQQEKQYPRDWSGSSGCLVVANPEGHKKKRLLLTLAKGVRRTIARRESERLADEKKRTKRKKGGHD